MRDIIFSIRDKHCLLMFLFLYVSRHIQFLNRSKLQLITGKLFAFLRKACEMSLYDTIETIKLLSAFPNKIVKDTLIKLKKVAKLHIKTLRYKIVIWKARHGECHNKKAATFSP